MSSKEKDNPSFSRAKKKAERVLNDPPRLSKLLEATRKKILNLEIDAVDLKGIMGTIRTFFRMILAYKNGQYQDVPWLTILMMVAALIYFVMPFDLLPDFIPVTGYIDDFSIILTVFNRFKEDIVAFQAWEHSINITSNH